MKSYDEMRELFLTNKITIDQWKEFCMEYLFDVLRDKEVQDVMKRLKERA